MTQFLVRLDADTDMDAIATQIDDMFERDKKATRTRPLAEHVQRTLRDLGQVIGFAQILGYVAVAVMALVLANTVFMSAQARRVVVVPASCA